MHANSRFKTRLPPYTIKGQAKIARYFVKDKDPLLSLCAKLQLNYIDLTLPAPLSGERIKPALARYNWIMSKCINARPGPGGSGFLSNAKSGFNNNRFC